MKPAPRVFKILKIQIVEFLKNECPPPNLVQKHTLAIYHSIHKLWGGGYV